MPMIAPFVIAENNGYILIDKEIFRKLVEGYLTAYPSERLYIKDSPEFASNALYFLKEEGNS